MSVRFVYITAVGREQAEFIGEKLVEDRLAACVNILAPMTAIYWWKGEVQHDTEAVLIAKTTAEQVERIVARVRELHTYAVPCVVALPIEQGNPAFLRWIVEETSPRRTAVA
jgi:periplasmic divalent cation tolerance protein